MSDLQGSTKQREDAIAKLKKDLEAKHAECEEQRRLVGEITREKVRGFFPGLLSIPLAVLQSAARRDKSREWDVAKHTGSSVVRSNGEVSEMPFVWRRPFPC